ncbi:MAG: LptA/OstA family protein, partial [Verrucomicrobiota bacterium]
HSETGEVHAENQVAVKVQLGAQGSSVLTFFPATGNTNRGPQVIEIFAHEFMAKERLATFLGEAHAHESPITGGEPRLRSDTLEMQLAADSQRAERITASNHVVFEQGTIGVTNGPAKYRKLTAQTLTARPSPQTNGVADLVADGDVQLIEPGATARGEHGTYTGATDIVELTGNPMVDTPKAIVTGQTLVWDKANNRFAGSGYKIKSKPEPVGKTAEALKAP